METTCRYVPQEIILLNTSIYENIALGDANVTRQQVEFALRRSRAWDFVSGLPEQMDTIVGERGARFSGGERQRIAIARALVYEPDLLVLDEATASLDRETESEIWETLAHESGKMTIVAISHQPSLVNVANRVYRIEGAKATLESCNGRPANRAAATQH